MTTTGTAHIAEAGIDGDGMPSPLGPDLEVSVILPCLDEAGAIAGCVTAARRALERAGLAGEVIVVDNGSGDGSGELAMRAGATVLREDRKGYGQAYLMGFAAAAGRYIVMADSDGTYDLADIPRFVAELENGADFVIGSRLKGNIHDGAMPWLHRRIGNPFLTGVLNRFFGTGVSDAHCGMRAFRRDLLPRLRLRAVGMELASEQIVRAGKLALDIREIPIEYHARAGTSKLSTFNDGWRHLRLLLVHSPTWLFIVPGVVVLALGLAGAAVVLTGVELLGRHWHLHALIASVMAGVTGTQLLQFGVFARSYAAWHLGESDELFDRVRARLRLETVLFAGLAILLAAFVAGGVVFVNWVQADFGHLGFEYLAVVALGLATIGIQVLFGAFLLSVLGLGGPTRGHPVEAMTPAPLDGQAVSRTLAGTESR